MGIKVRQFMAKSVFRRPHKRRAISWPLLEALVCLVSLSGVSSAHALAFGPVRVLSATGQPLRLEVDLLDVRETPVSARALPTSEERDRFFDKPLGYDVKTEIKRQPDGRYILRLTSSQPIAQPALKFALEVDDGEGVLARDFSVRLGAAETATRAPAPAPEPAQTRAAPPMPAPPAASASPAAPATTAPSPAAPAPSPTPSAAPVAPTTAGAGLAPAAPAQPSSPAARASSPSRPAAGASAPPVAVREPVRPSASSVAAGEFSGGAPDDAAARGRGRSRSANERAEFEALLKPPQLELGTEPAPPGSAPTRAKPGPVLREPRVAAASPRPPSSASIYSYGDTESADTGARTPTIARAAPGTPPVSARQAAPASPKRVDSGVRRATGDAVKPKKAPKHRTRPQKVAPAPTAPPTPRPSTRKPTTVVQGPEKSPSKAAAEAPSQALVPPQDRPAKESATRAAPTPPSAGVDATAARPSATTASPSASRPSVGAASQPERGASAAPPEKTADAAQAAAAGVAASTVTPASAPAVAASAAVAAPSGPASEAASVPASVASQATAAPTPKAPVPTTASSESEQDSLSGYWVGLGGAALVAGALLAWRRRQRQQRNDYIDLASLRALQPAGDGVRDDIAVWPKPPEPAQAPEADALSRFPAQDEHAFGDSLAQTREAQQPPRGVAEEAAQAFEDSAHASVEHGSSAPHAEAGAATQAGEFEALSARLSEARALLEQGRHEEAGASARNIVDLCEALEAELADLNRKLRN